MVLQEDGRIGNTWLWHNNTATQNYGTVLGDYAPEVNTTLELYNGKLTLKKKLANGTTTSKVIAEL